MILTITALLILSFLQSGIISLNLVLAFLLSRAFVINNKNNYWLAFLFGLLVSLLLGLPLGALSLLYILMVAVVYLLKRAEFSSYWLILLPLLFIFFSADQFFQGLLGHYSLNWMTVIFEVIAALPIFIFVKFWEERFVPPENIKLKISK